MNPFLKAIDKFAYDTADWWNRDEDLEQKSAVNQMVHGTYDRARKNMSPAAYDVALDTQVFPSVTDVKQSLLSKGQDTDAGKQFQKMQAELRDTNVNRGQVAGERLNRNEFSEGDKEYRRRGREMEYTDALLGPARKKALFGDQGVLDRIFPYWQINSDGASAASSYDPRKFALENLQDEEDVNEIPWFHRDSSGSYLNQETMTGLLDNQYTGAGQLFVPSGERGFQNVARYFTHRDDGKGKLDSLLAGLGEFASDSAIGIGRTLGLTDQDYSDTGQEIQRSMLAKKIEDLASVPVEDGPNRNAEAQELEDMYERLGYLDYDKGHFLAHGKQPHWTEVAAMNALPGLADVTGLAAGVNGLVRGGMKSGLRGALLAGSNAARREAYEDAITNLGVSTGLTYANELAGGTPEPTRQQVLDQILMNNNYHDAFDRENKQELLRQKLLQAMPGDRLTAD